MGSRQRATGGEARRGVRAAVLAGALVAGVAAAPVLVPVPAGADGTETLGPASLTPAAGSGIAVAGAGLFVQPGSFSVDVPADATVEQVLLYAEVGHRTGDASGNLPDCNIFVNGHEIVCTLIGGPTGFYGNVRTATNRYDITGLHLVGPGRSTLTVDGLDTDEVDDGAAVVVIYRRPGAAAEIAVHDGNDIAFVDFAPPRNTTAPQTFRFTPAAVARQAQLGLVVNSIHDPVDQVNRRHRPNALLITMAGVTTRIDEPFADDQGLELDSQVREVTIPAGVDAMTVQMVSERDGSGDLPASLVWLVAALAVPTPPPPPTSTSAAASTTVVGPPSPTVTVTGPVLPFTGGSPSTAVVGVTAVGAGMLLIALSRRGRRPAANLVTGRRDGGPGHR